jgi:hypothetical protein
VEEAYNQDRTTPRSLLSVTPTRSTHAHAQPCEHRSGLRSAPHRTAPRTRLQRSDQPLDGCLVVPFCTKRTLYMSTTPAGAPVIARWQGQLK